NNTDKYVKIEEVYFYYTVNGVESKSTYDLGIMTRTDEGGNTYTYVDYCTYVPQGTTQAFSACRTGAKPLGCAAGDSTCDQPADSSSSTAPYAASLNMYIGGLPDQASKSSVYPIRMELVGSFKATANGEDIDRFNKREYFTTR
ncbi:hypothetical protein GW916_07965, partial [bacterium]|nr:hypothetical protein [bacterium]